MWAQAKRAAEAALAEQRGNEARERAALRTILDSKMRGLLADLSRSLGDLPLEVQAVWCERVASACCRRWWVTISEPSGAALHVMQTVLWLLMALNLAQVQQAQRAPRQLAALTNLLSATVTAISAAAP